MQLHVQVAADFAFIPFGGGARKCVGDQFALLEATVALSMLLRSACHASLAVTDISHELIVVFAYPLICIFWPFRTSKSQ